MKLDLQVLIVSLVSVANILLLIYQTRKRMPAEIEKMRAEKIESLSEAAESNLEGARISSTLLIERIAELKRDRRDAWNYIAILKRQIIEDARLEPKPYIPSESDPKIPVVRS